MKELSIVVDTDHLERVTRGTAISALSELVWNALDAEATRIDICIKPSTLAGDQAIDSIEITDNGHGMMPDDIQQAFGHLGGSWKANSERSKNRKVRIHGKAGQGRFKALALGDRVEWSTVASRTSTNLRTRLWVERAALKRCRVHEPENTIDNVGTIVTIHNPTSLAHLFARGEQTKERLTSIFALRIREDPNLQISLNGESLDTSSIQSGVAIYTIDLNDSAQSVVELTIIEWHQDVDRALHLCDLAGASLQVVPPGIQAPTFNFTAYARWAGFREHEHLLSLAEMSSDLGPVISTIQDRMREHFRQQASLHDGRVIQQWKDEDVYPFSDEDDETIIEAAEHQVFDLVALTMNASNGAFARTAPSSKRVTLQLLRQAVRQTPSTVHRIIEEVMQLETERRDELIKLLDHTDLSRIISASRRVTDRIRFIEELDTILFKYAGEVGEKAHLHPILEHELWIFGDHFESAISERGLTEVLREHVKILGRDELVTKPVRGDDGRIARFDLMLSARVAGRGRRKAEHLVVELKAPAKVLGTTEYGKLQDYATAVLNNPRFSSSETSWEFWLIGNKLDPSLRRMVGMETSNPSPGLVDQGDNYLFWVVPWSHLIEQHRRKLIFMEEVLTKKTDSENTLEYLKQTYAEHLPDAVLSNDV